ncbi:hypothetical protein [Coleofasciculus sp. G2-EDA-02]|uniref:hypothetical protein n=1 Tax=Coleofasciculus sp. G2-EDA-02 TaxID=3069529 RepID=UPI0032F97763
MNHAYLRFLKLSAQTINLDRIDWIDWIYPDDGKPCIQIVFGFESLFLSPDGEDAAILRDYSQLISIEHKVPQRSEGVRGQDEA